MNLRLWYNLNKAKNDLNPSGRFKRELGAQLSSRFDEIYGGKNIWYRYVWVRTTRIIIAGSVGVSMVGTSVYAYNSPQVTEGNVLYPIKISLEKIEERTKTTPEEKVKFLFKKIERREAEREVVVDRVGEEIKLTFSAIAPTLSTTSTPATTTISFQPIVITARPLEVVSVDRALDEVEHNLEEIESKLNSSEESKKLKEKIVERLNRHKIKETKLSDFTLINSSTASSTSPLLPTSTIAEFDRDDEITNNKKSNFFENKIIKKFRKEKKVEKIKIIQNERGELKAVDNGNEYSLYSSSSSKNIEQIINSSTPIRLEIREHDQEAKWYKSEGKTESIGSIKPTEFENKRREEQKREEEKRVEQRDEDKSDTSESNRESDERD